MSLFFVMLGFIFVLSLPVLIAKACNSNKSMMFISSLLVLAEIICLVPIMLKDMFGEFPNFYINFFDINIGVWLFMINLILVIWSNRKKLSK